VLSISPGYTATEICELVFEYKGLSHGSKAGWLAERGLTGRRMGRWRDSVLGGDLDKGLIPREGSAVKRSPAEQTSIARRRAAEQAAHADEVRQLNTRIRELEQSNGRLTQANDALGKAIGLLHERNAHEPDATAVSNDPSDSSTSKPDSSSS
jgi:hypothetical protein